MTAIFIFTLLLTAAVFTSQAADMKRTDSNDVREKSTSIETRDEPVHHAFGTVRKLDAARGTVLIWHGPVKSLNWSSIIMRFSVADTALFERLVVGQEVDFDFIKREGDYVITAVQ